MRRRRIARKAVKTAIIAKTARRLRAQTIQIDAIATRRRGTQGREKEKSSHDRFTQLQ